SGARDSLPIRATTPPFPAREGGVGGVRKEPPPARAGGVRKGPLLAAASFLIWLGLTLPTFAPGFSRAVQAEAALAPARAAQARGDLAEAQAEYTTAVGLEPTFAAARRDLGAIQVQAGQTQIATATWTDALAHEPGDWRTRALLADLWRRLDEPKKATGTV